MKRPDYWQHKVSVFLHDPVHKALKIQGHEVRAAEIATLLHQVLPNKNEYQSADAMASGLTRAALPGHHDDQQRNGAVDFMAKDNSVITHPLVNNADLRLDLPPSMTVDKVHQAVLALLKKDIGEGLTAEELDLLRLESENRAPLNAFFNRTSDPEGWSRALFHYLFFALKKRLRAENAGGLGALWDFLPADTRMPDHAVWHHCGLASALASAMKDDPNGSASLAVFSITPVQPFIAKARKLRDHWVGSVILSYLSFTGLRRVSEALGPDHVMYPSLHDQTMVDAWLDREFHLGHLLTEPDENVRRHTEESRGIASFPNKFVFVVSTNMAQEVCQDIQKAIQAEWLRLAGHVREYLAPKGEAGRATRGIFDHQIGDYWQFGFAAAKLLGLDDTADLAGLLHDSKWSVEQETVAAFSGPYGANGRRLARLYSATHTLTQSLLAATKLKPNRVRRAQQGEKCPLCGEHEILHDFIRPGSTSAHEYKMGVKAFWDGLRARMNSGESFAQVGKNERLCAVCAMKRFLPQALDRHKDEPLYEVLRKDAEKFPSTTEMAAHDYLSRLTEHVSVTSSEFGALINALHDEEAEAKDDETSRAVKMINAAGVKVGVKYEDRDKYYTVLLMDGDKMGDLINGATIEATWADVIHPELRARFNRPDFAKGSPLRGRLQARRTLNPALHASISDSLNGFARFGVAPVIRQAGGRLIYAGGDDVCAVMPLNTVLKAADRIRRSYTMGFVRYAEAGAEPVSGAPTDLSGRLGLHLGEATGISISGAVVIAHHKEPLREVLRDAHALLDGTAKERAGRNALAIRLKKRSGGDRDVYFQWNEKNPFRDNEELLSESFSALMDDVRDDDLASRLVYRLADLENALVPLAGTTQDIETNRERIFKLFLYEVRHSGKFMAAADKNEMEAKAAVMASRLAGICLRRPVGQPDWFNPEAAVVARFLAPASSRRP